VPVVPLWRRTHSRVQVGPSDPRTRAADSWVEEGITALGPPPANIPSSGPHSQSISRSRSHRIFHFHHPPVRKSTIVRSGSVSEAVNASTSSLSRGKIAIRLGAVDCHSRVTHFDSVWELGGFGLAVRLLFGLRLHAATSTGHVLTRQQNSRFRITTKAELATKSLWILVPLKLEPMVGVEPTTYGLRNRCSATELHWLPERSNSRPGGGGDRQQGAYIPPAGSDASAGKGPITHQCMLSFCASRTRSSRSWISSICWRRSAS
jgi:hypothetical protein